MNDARPMHDITMLTQAGRAMGKIDKWGPRGITMVNFEEIEAMAVTLTALGVPSIPPGLTDQQAADHLLAHLNLTGENHDDRADQNP